MDTSLVAGLGLSHSLILVALWVHPEGESVTDIILSVTLLLNTYFYLCPPHHTYISGHSIAYLHVFALHT
jgi:hypothetical protein